MILTNKTAAALLRAATANRFCAYVSSVVFDALLFYAVPCPHGYSERAIE